jgi:hypothetical protein
MKKFALLLSFVFVAGVAVAQEAGKAPEAAKAPAVAKTAETAKAHAAMKTHDVQAEIVSVDAEKKTLTIKGETENKTVPVEGKAVAALKNVKAGEKHTLTCKDNDKGEHQAVVDIKPAAAEKK